VQSQFIVKATGTVTIGGYVEGGLIVAGKDLLVQQGVVGASTELIAGGDVMAKYIQEASVSAGGDLKVGSHIHNASVRAGGRIVIPGNREGESKALVGGLTWGAAGISAGSLGSAYNSSTQVVAGVDPVLVNRSEHIRANLLACEAKQRKLLKKLRAETFDLTMIKKSSPPALRRSRDSPCSWPSRTWPRCLNCGTISGGSSPRSPPASAGSHCKTSVDVTREVFAGVELRIGEQTERIRRHTARVSFKLVEEGDDLKIVTEALTRIVKFT
jgi:uncharacterized protein (DUF342 family)